MKLEKHKLFNKIKKVTAVLIAAFVVNAMLLITLDTYSWFTSQAESSAIVRAAATSDILEEMGLVDSEGVFHDFSGENNEVVLNPDYIRVKGTALNNMCTIFFELSPSINKYLLHINPILVEGQTRAEENINVNLKPNEFNALTVMKDQYIDGTITFKYLNGYINKTVNVRFTVDFLKKKDRETVNFIIEKETEIATLKSELEKLTLQIADLETKQQLLAGENESLNKTIMELEQANNEKLESIKLLEGEISIYSEKLKELEAVVHQDPETNIEGNATVEEENKENEDAKPEPSESSPNENATIEAPKVTTPPEAPKTP